ncbi:hypothetical protein Aduo_006282 [Ancylostoma duodenale]
MALHFHRIPISAKNVEYKGDNEDSEKCRSTTALLQCSILRISEAKEHVEKLYKEILDEYKNCEDTLEKREILAEIHQITEESELHNSGGKRPHRCFNRKAQ